MTGSRLILTGILLALFSVAGCSSSEPTPTFEPTAAPTATATIAPTSTPEPTPTEVSTLSDIDAIDLRCIDFHPGVQVQEGPNHWYEISAALTNKGNVVVQVNAHIEILERRSDGLTLVGETNRVQSVDTRRPVVFYERLDLQPSSENYVCRVTFTIESKPDGVTATGLVDVESIYAP